MPTTFAADIRRMMEDWNRATPAQREAALAEAKRRADAAERRILEAK